MKKIIGILALTIMTTFFGTCAQAQKIVKSSYIDVNNNGSYDKGIDLVVVQKLPGGMSGDFRIGKFNFRYVTFSDLSRVSLRQSANALLQQVREANLRLIGYNGHKPIVIMPTSGILNDLLAKRSSIVRHDGKFFIRQGTFISNAV